MDLVFVLSVIGGLMTCINQTLVRRKNWIGWALALPNIALFMFVNYQSGAYGYAFLLGPFWLVNAVWAIRDWRRDAARSAHSTNPHGGERDEERVDQSQRAAAG